MFCSAVPHGSIPHCSVLSQLEKDTSETQLHQHSCATANYFSVKWCLIMDNQLFSAEAFPLGKVGGIPCLRALRAVCAQATGGYWGGVTDITLESRAQQTQGDNPPNVLKETSSMCEHALSILCLPKQHGLNQMVP